ncbi:hypothetical protein [Sediminispirochaeta smaragdinae]|uniref:Lipoprotein n=1 Tax=Sediminispirochaeta smaragdinae (strain DSM 11293 / JCM 15392 / SEBR 4228) TaxID=573413 RepID=E1R240_SEDSS|nr:hypothetical protein [Sediminispirochaeta smaragdinae]ADK81925.1 hypothetical protein Spirs_2822 [Sediminispirochaeta smaragdinae DSM 11293]
MEKIIEKITVSFLILILFSCTSFPALNPPASATQTGPRTIILNGEEISEEDVGGFISWYGQDFIEAGPIIVEVGFFGDPNLEGLGFILYDGGFTGELTYYRRTGLEHRWDWGPNETDYAFVIQTDGTGLYYDFTKVKKGKSTTASAVYICHKR